MFLLLNAHIALYLRRHYDLRDLKLFLHERTMRVSTGDPLAPLSKSILNFKIATKLLHPRLLIKNIFINLNAKFLFVLKLVCSFSYTSHLN